MKETHEGTGDHMHKHTEGFCREEVRQRQRAWVCNRAYALGETEEKRGWIGRDGEGGETLGKARGEDVRRSREETSGSNGASSLCEMTPGAWTPQTVLHE